MHTHTFKNILMLGVALLSLSACDLERLSRVGTGPQLAHVESPTDQQGYRPVSMPMPAPETATRMPNSLWQAGARAFFKDQRASRIGDIVTVLISLDDKAKFENKTEAKRTGTQDTDVAGLFGFQNRLDDILGLTDGATAQNLVNTSTSTEAKGDGKIDRKEQIELKVAATVTQIMPNGNLVVNGRQEILVNHEKRELLVAGVIRPEDISSANAINYDQIAEARIMYGGKGTLSDIQYPRYGQEFYDVIMPF